MALPMSGSGPLPLTVVIASRDRAPLLRQTLETLRLHLRPVDEVVVVDSASRTKETSEVAREFGYRILRLSQPGTSRARNAGWTSSSNALCAFIDDDCSITSGWTERIGRAFADERLGFVTGRVEPDRPTNVAMSVFIEEAPRRFEELADPAKFGGGSNMAFRREALAKVGGFDEGMGPATTLRAAEDQDLFRRIVRAGWAGAYDPTILVTHRQWRTRTQSIRRQFDYGVGAAAVAVKAIRLRDRDGWGMLRSRLWRNGVALTARNLRIGYESGAAAALVRTAGVLVGTPIAWAAPMVDGRYRG
jgi:cellulose synthase/poly-beta-1,6-N-acetylglucosamine synthase-like glycosyltransferase